jgi:hypothetical protein
VPRAAVPFPADVHRSGSTGRNCQWTGAANTVSPDVTEVDHVLTAATRKNIKSNLSTLSLAFYSYRSLCLSQIKSEYIGGVIAIECWICRTYHPLT